MAFLQKTLAYSIPLNFKISPLVKRFYFPFRYWPSGVSKLQYLAFLRPPFHIKNGCIAGHRWPLTAYHTTLLLIQICIYTQETAKRDVISSTWHSSFDLCHTRWRHMRHIVYQLRCDPNGNTYYINSYENEIEPNEFYSNDQNKLAEVWSI